MVVATGSSLSVLIGNGDGTFDPAVTYDAGLSAGRSVAGDLNGDGRTDVVVADSSYNTAISTLLNAPPGGALADATATLTVQSGTTLTGTSGNDIVLSGAADQTMTGGNGADNFVFKAGAIGHDAITDYTPGTDALLFDQSVFATATALLDATADVNGDAVITTLGGDTVTLTHVTKADLTAHQGDFHFLV
jgi:Ca2+-binding RTX toxin-like protein